MLLLALTPQKARELEGKLRNRAMEKEYLARVQGKFPEEETTCEAPLRVLSFKKGLNVVDEESMVLVER